MKAQRVFFSLTGVLCLVGTVQAQVNQFPDFDPYAGVRMARLDYQQPMQTPMLEDAGPNSFRPVMRTPVKKGAEAVNAPQPAPSAAPTPPPSSAYEAAAASNWSNDCGPSLPSCCGCNNCCNNNNWYAYVGGLVMGRDMPNHYWTTFNTANPANQLLYFPGADWGGGVDTRLGYWFGCGGCGDPCNACNSCGCGRFGIEAVYWGAWGLTGTNGIYDSTNQLGTVQDVGLVSFGGNALGGWFDNSRAVRLSRNDDVNNVELNFMYMPVVNNNWFSMVGLAGVRYLNFNEDLLWGTLAGTAPVGAQFGDDPTNEAYVSCDAKNNMVGFQLGSYMNFQVCNTIGIFAIPKIGIFGNHASVHNRVATGDGIVATFDDSGNALDINASKNVFSMVGSIDVGFNWAFTNHWSFIGGYRAVLATNVALGDNQIPQFFADEAGWREVKTNGSLILHGAFAGLEARF